MASEQFQTHKLYTQLLSNIVKSTCNLSYRSNNPKIVIEQNREEYR